MRVDVQGSGTLGYFAWALEGSLITEPIARYLLTEGAKPNEAVQAIRQTVTQSLRPSRGPLFDPARADQFNPEDISSTSGFGVSSASAAYYELTRRTPYGPQDLEAQYASDEEDDRPNSLSDAAYQLMLTSFLGVFSEISEASQWLALLMVRGGFNRQMAISRFFSEVFGLDFDLAPGRLPSRSLIVRSARDILDKPMAIDNLESLAHEYVSRPRS
jgi:hypothetical protein